MTDFDITADSSNQEAKGTARSYGLPQCVDVHTATRKCSAVTGKNRDRLVWKSQNIGLEAEGCLLDVFSAVTKYAVARGRR
jgi:hypothetical protein